MHAQVPFYADELLYITVHYAYFSTYRMVNSGDATFFWAHTVMRTEQRLKRNDM